MIHRRLLFRVILAALALGATAAAPVLDRSPVVVLPPGVKVVADLEYARVNGHALLLDLYLPRQAKGRIPVVLWVHGGGWIMGDRHDPTAVPLAGEGYAVASIDYRLNSEALFPAQIQDCKAAVRWLRANAGKYHLDPDHVGAWGASAGGHLVALLGTTGGVKELEGDEGNGQFSSRVQAVCDFFGPSDLTKLDTRALYKALKIDQRIGADHGAGAPPPGGSSHDASADSFESRLLGGAPDRLKQKAIQASPITYISKDDPPFLIMHGDRDPMLPLVQSEILHDALQKAGVQVTLHIVPGGSHGFGDAKHPGLVGGPENFARVKGFFDKHLKGGRQP
ncbi:MAG TPA: alpha/beta hydrolase [Tepidisphaeraceae bacterium]|nr:alpha/beta hydrolase [Tepidisphaeraceae bacterium]